MYVSLVFVDNLRPVSVYSYYEWISPFRWSPNVNIMNAFAYVRYCRRPHHAHPCALIFSASSLAPLHKPGSGPLFSHIMSGVA